MSYNEEYKMKGEYMVLCGEKVTPCDKAVTEYAKKVHIDLKELLPSTKANLKRIICGENNNVRGSR